MIHQPQIDLQVTRCTDCRHYYAYERHSYCRCPHCAESRIDRLVQEACDLERTVSALKGVITRMKNARKKRTA